MANKFNRSTTATRTDTKASRKKNTVPHPYKKTGAKARAKVQRREEAEARQKAWDKLTVIEKLASLDMRNMRAEKQRKKLQKQLEVA